MFFINCSREKYMVRIKNIHQKYKIDKNHIKTKKSETKSQNLNSELFSSRTRIMTDASGTKGVSPKVCVGRLS